MDRLGILYGSEITTASGVLGDSKLRNYAMMYCANASSRTLRDAKGVNIEADNGLL